VESGETSSSTSIPLSSRGQTLPMHGSPGNSGPGSPRGGKNGVETGSRFARVLRAARMDQQSSAEERTQALQQLLFAAPRSGPTAMDTGAAVPLIDQARKPRDEPVTFLHVNCPNFSEAACKEPKVAWHHLLLVLSQKGSPLRPLDILPMSAASPVNRLESSTESGRRRQSSTAPALLGAAVDGPKRYVPFVLKASGRLGPEAGTFLEYLQSICSFPILRFRALVGVLSAKHNARMALR
jgi:hypothetical protein